MRSFWTLAGRAWPADLPERAWASRCPGLSLPHLEREGVLVRRTLRPFEVVECVSCGGLARVARELGAWVGVCEGDLDCPGTPLGPEAVALRVDEAGVLRRLCTTLELAGALDFGEMFVGLGRTRIGHEWVGFEFCRRPSATGLLAELERRVAGESGVRVVLAPATRRIPASAPARVGSVAVLWVGLDEVLTLSPEWAVSLDAITGRRSFSGWVPPARPGLVISGKGAEWDGVALPLSPRAMRLLRVLAAAPGEVLPRAALAAAVWPDEHTRTGALARGVNPDDIDADFGTSSRSFAGTSARSAW